MSEPRKILIADGTPSTLPDLKPALREIGGDVIPVADALYVLVMATRHKPAAVVLGAHLTAGGSLTALRPLRASVHTASIPVIALASPGTGVAR